MPRKKAKKKVPKCADTIQAHAKAIVRLSKKKPGKADFERASKKKKAFWE